MQNQFPFYEDRIVDVARREDPFVGAMLEQMYDQDPYRGYGQLGDNYKPDISVDFEDLFGLNDNLDTTGEFDVSELGLPQIMDWQTDPYEKLSLDELIELGADENQIAQYLGVV